MKIHDIAVEQALQALARKHPELVKPPAWVAEQLSVIALAGVLKKAS